MPAARSRITRSTSRSRAKAPTAMPASPASSATWVRRLSPGSDRSTRSTTAARWRSNWRRRRRSNGRATELHVGAARVRVAEGRVDLGSCTSMRARSRPAAPSTAFRSTALMRTRGVRSPLASTLVIAGDWSVAATPRLNGIVHVRRERRRPVRRPKPEPPGPAGWRWASPRSKPRRGSRTTTSPQRRRCAGRAATPTPRFPSRPADGAPGRIALDAPIEADPGRRTCPLRRCNLGWGRWRSSTGRAHVDLSAKGSLARVVLDGALAADAHAP